MSAPNSATDICNLSLDHIKTDNISDVASPSNDQGRACMRWFETTKRAILRRHTWNFATKRVTLAPLGTDPAFEYSNHYQLPNDYLRLVSINGQPVSQVDCTVEDKKLLINEATSVNLVYVYDHSNFHRWDPLAIDVLSYALALRIGRPLGVSPNDLKLLKEMLDDLWMEAEAVDGQERPPVRVEYSRALRARRGFTHGRRANGTRYDFED